MKIICEEITIFMTAISYVLGIFVGIYTGKKHKK